VAQRVDRGIAVLFLDHGTRRGEWSAARPGCTLPPGKTRYPLYRRLVGPQGRSGRAENLVPTGIRSPVRPAPSQSLYRLSYRAHLVFDKSVPRVYEQQFCMKCVKRMKCQDQTLTRVWPTQIISFADNSTLRG